MDPEEEEIEDGELRSSEVTEEEKEKIFQESLDIVDIDPFDFY